MASSMVRGRTSAVALPRTRLPRKLGSMPDCEVVLWGLIAGPGVESCCWVWMATPSSGFPPLVLVVAAPLGVPWACWAGANWVVAARISSTTVPLVAPRDAPL